MNCDLVTTELQAYLDGECPRREAATIRDHMSTCETCSAEYESLRRLNALLVQADAFTDEKKQKDVTRIHRVSYPWGRTVIAACLVLVAVLCVSLPKHKGAVDPDAAVAAALDNINTWHLSGWKLIGGKQVSWDIWGRRAPYFCYEKLGDDITVDDGKTTRRILPADASLGRPQRMVVVTSDTPPADFQAALQQAMMSMMEPDVVTMVSSWDWRNGGGMFAQKPYKQTASEAVYRREWDEGMEGVNAYKIYTIDKRTWLPARYELNSHTDTDAWDTEYLAASYNVVLPDDVLNPQVAAAATAADFTGKSGTPVRLEAQSYRIGPFVVRAVVKAIDPRGYALLQVSTTLNGRLIGNDQSSIFAVSTTLYDDDQNIRAVSPAGPEQYVYVDRILAMPSSGPTSYVLVPLEDIKSSRWLPETLTCKIGFSVAINKRDSDAKGENGINLPRNGNDTFLQQALPMEIPVGKWALVPDIQSELPPDMKKQAVYSGLQRTADLERSTFYYMSEAYEYRFYLAHRKQYGDAVINPDGTLNLQNTKTPLNVTHLLDLDKKYAAEIARDKLQQQERAVYWLHEAIAHDNSLPAQSRAWSEPVDETALINTYHGIGDKADMRKGLEKRLDAARREHLGNSLDARQIEYELKTNIFPEDAGYKGPS